MNLKAGFPYWLVKNGLPFEYPKLESDLNTDVLVLGGGISGALAAFHLARAGIPCAVADARSIGLGSTCASTSLLQYEIDVPLYRLEKMIGSPAAVHSYHACRRAIEQLGDIARELQFNDHQERHSLYYAAHRKDIGWLKEEFEARLRSGFNVQWLDVTDTKKLYGFGAPAILSYHGAQTNAYLFAHRLHQFSIRCGMPVFDRTPVKTIRHHRNGIIAKTANGHTIRAKKLIYATGYEVVEQIAKPIVKLHSTYAVASEPLESYQPVWKDEAIIWNTATPYLYMRTTPDRRIIAGGRDEQFYAAARRDRLIPSKTKQLAKDAQKLFPAIPFIPEFGWAGVFGATKDGLPFIGPCRGYPNCFFALGFGGNGIVFSQVAALTIAGLLSGTLQKTDPAFSFDRV